MTNPYKFKRNIALVATVMALVVVLLGAYTRLEDAGLGCPDWPGCYGSLTVPEGASEIAAAELAYPERPVEAKKAWAEMIHRYFASSLGLVIMIMTIHGWMQRRKHRNFPVKLSSILLVLVIFQGLLGMWTVTMKLNPVIVMAHLLGGFATLALLFSQTLLSHQQLVKSEPNRSPLTLAKAAFMVLLILLLQIALGGWTSANYAAMMCTDLPFCESNWISQWSFSEAFQLWGHGADNYEFGVKSLDARTTIHVSHRIWSLVTLFSVILLSIKLMKLDGLIAILGKSLLILISIQFLLGLSNVVFSLPLAVAVAHNGGGAIAFAILVAVNFIIHQKNTSDHG